MNLALMLAQLNLNTNSLISALIVLVIAIILFVALWNLVVPFLGRFANTVLAIAVIILILIIARIFGLV